MSTLTAQKPGTQHNDIGEAAPRATRRVVAVLGALVGVAGIEHGIGEMLQGPGRPDGLLIESWPHVPALEVLSGEPAMTVIPNLWVTGVLALAVGLALAVWAVGFATRRHGGTVLIGMSVLLLLFGGGLLPPLMGIVLGVVAAHTGTRRHRMPGPFLRRLSPAWPFFLGAALVGYLGLMPGMLLAHVWGVASEPLVMLLAAVAFTGFGFALATASAADRLQTHEMGQT